METRRLGKSDLELTVIGLGTWAIGGEWDYGWGRQDDSDSLRSILEALELGINWIDTAPAYGLGHAEEVVGKAVREWCAAGRRRPILATKCGLVPVGNGKVKSALNRASIIAECEGSLRRLDVDCIDLYQIHWPDPAGEIGEGFQTLLELQQQGKIRWAGVSNFSVPQLEHVSQYGVVASLQPPYSMINRGIEQKILPWCRESQIGVIAYSPLQCGLLTGKVNREWLQALDASDWRKTKSDFFREPKLSRALSFIDEIQKLPLAQTSSLMALALRWLLDAPGVTAAICGARRPGQIKQIIEAISGNISSAERDQIDLIYNNIFSERGGVV